MGRHAVQHQVLEQPLGQRHHQALRGLVAAQRSAWCSLEVEALDARLHQPDALVAGLKAQRVTQGQPAAQAAARTRVTGQQVQLGGQAPGLGIQAQLRIGKAQIEHVEQAALDRKALRQLGLQLALAESEVAWRAQARWQQPVATAGRIRA